MSDTPDAHGAGDLDWAWARLGISPTTDPMEVDRAYGRAVKARMAADPQALDFVDLGEARVAIEAALRGRPAPVTPPAAGADRLAADLTQALGAVLNALPGAGHAADPQRMAHVLAAQQAMAEHLAALGGAPPAPGQAPTPASPAPETPAVAPSHSMAAALAALRGAPGEAAAPEPHRPTMHPEPAAPADPQQIFAQLLAAQQQAMQQLAASMSSPPAPGRPHDAPELVEPAPIEPAHPAAATTPVTPSAPGPASASANPYAVPSEGPADAAAQAHAARQEAARQLAALQVNPHHAAEPPAETPIQDPPPDAPLDERTAAFVAAIQAHRAAGDISGAIARIDRLFATEPPASPLVEEIDLQLFRAIALQRTLGAQLFNHLVERFEWRDAAGRIADEEPEAHATLLSRVDAEDWYLTLLQAARDGDAIAAAAIARRTGAAAPLRLDEAGQQQARSLISQLWTHADFLLERFDARSLAALREAVEGAPLISGVAQPDKVDRRRAARKIVNRYPLRSKAAIAGGFVVAIVVAVLGLRTIQGPATGLTDLSPQAQARRIIDQTQSQWVALRALDGSVLVYFSQLLACRPALKAIRYGIDRDTPDTDFPLPPDKGKWPQEIDMNAVVYVKAPPTTKYVSVQLTYADGSTSEVHTYHIGDTP